MVTSSRRPGASTLGCLFTILVIVAIAYFSIDFGEAFWRNAEYKDEMKQELRFHADRPDDQILSHMRIVADSLGLPDDAGQVTITRDAPTRTISMDAHYDVTVKLPYYERVVHFAPHVSDSF